MLRSLNAVAKQLGGNQGKFKIVTKEMKCALDSTGIYRYSSSDLLGGPVVKTAVPVLGLWVRFLVRELRFQCHGHNVKNQMQQLQIY